MASWYQVVLLTKAARLKTRFMIVLGWLPLCLLPLRNVFSPTYIYMKTSSYECKTHPCLLWKQRHCPHPNDLLAPPRDVHPKNLKWGACTVWPGRLLRFCSTRGRLLRMMLVFRWKGVYGAFTPGGAFTSIIAVQQCHTWYIHRTQQSVLPGTNTIRTYFMWCINVFCTRTGRLFVRPTNYRSRK